MNAFAALKDSKKYQHTNRKKSASRQTTFALFTFKNEEERIRFYYKLKLLWLYPLIAIGIFLISAMFVSSRTIRIICAIFLSIFPWLTITDKMYLSRYRHLRTQLLVLLQTLTTSVSSGYSLEKSFANIRGIIEHTFGKKSVLIRPLKNIENKIELHTSMQEALTSFAKELNFPEIEPIFIALGLSGKIGSNSLAILRSSCQMLSELNSVSDEIDAQNSGKNAEAVMLCIMPFAITFALDKMSSSYLSEAKSTPVGSIILLVSFVLCIISCALLFRFMTHDSKSNKTKHNKLDDKTKSTILVDFVQKIMPNSFISARYELFSELSLTPKIHYEEYLRKILLSSIVGVFLTSLILHLADKPLILAIAAPLLLTYLNYTDAKKSALLRREELMKDTPLFLCLLTTLLEAGVMLPRAIEICSNAFPNNKNLSMEIKNIHAMILSGISASEAIEKFSLRLKIPEAQAAFLLVARYGRLGTSEVLNLLSLQASSCWSLCRNSARKKQERESLGLLLPMTLDFICVLLVATTPAIISLGL